MFSSKFHNLTSQCSWQYFHYQTWFPSCWANIEFKLIFESYQKDKSVITEFLGVPSTLDPWSHIIKREIVVIPIIIHALNSYCALCCEHLSFLCCQWGPSGRWEDLVLLCIFIRWAKALRAKFPDSKHDSCIESSVPLTSQTKPSENMIWDNWESTQSWQTLGAVLRFCTLIIREV